MGGPAYTSEDFTVEVGTTTSGFVTSVDVSGGTSGLTFTGGPITSTGVITLSGGTLSASYGGTGLASFQVGQVLFGATSSTMGQDSNFFWDNSNKRLGLGTASPTVQLNTTDKAILGGGLPVASAVGNYWQFGDASYTPQPTTGTWTGPRGLFYGSNVPMPVAGSGIFGSVAAINFTGAGNPAYLIGSISEAAMSITGSVTNLIGAYSRASIQNNAAGLAAATNSLASQGVTYAVNLTGSSKGFVSANGYVATLRSAQFATTVISNYTAFRADNSQTPQDAGFFEGYQDSGSCTVTTAQGFYYVPIMAANTNQYGFRCDPVPDTTGVSQQYQVYCYAQPGYSNAAKGWYMVTGPKAHFGGRVGIGTYTPEAHLEVASTVNSAPYYPSGIQISQFGTAAPPTLAFRQGRGSVTSPLVANAGDALGQVVFSGLGIGATAGYPAQAIIAGRLESGSSTTSAPTTIEQYTGATFPALSSGTYGLGTTSVPNGLYKRTALDSTGVITNYDQPYCLACLLTDQIIPNSIATDINFNVNTQIQGDPTRGGAYVHDPAVNNNRFTAAKSGVYFFTFHCWFAANSTGTRTIFISKFPTTGAIATATEPAPSGSVATKLSVSMMYYLAAGEYVTASALQTSGGSLNITGGGVGLTDFFFFKVA